LECKYKQAWLLELSDHNTELLTPQPKKSVSTKEAKAFIKSFKHIVNLRQAFTIQINLRIKLKLYACYDSLQATIHAKTKTRNP